VRLGGEVHDGVDRRLAEQAVHQRRIADVAVHEPVPRVVGDRRQVLQVAGVGQLVERDDVGVVMGEDVTDECRADKSGPSGDEQLHLN
jgi:hypothetical protein